MDDDVRSSIDRVLPEALRSLRRLAGIPVAFGGAVSGECRARRLEITGLAGTTSSALDGLRVSTGRGLGGVVLSTGRAQRVNDYARSRRITHDYDAAVNEEHLTSVIAVPVIAGGVVRAVLYGAIRDQQPIGNRALHAAEAVAASIPAGLRGNPRGHAQAAGAEAAGSRASALAELAAIAREIADPALRARLARVHRALSRDTPGRPAAGPAHPAVLSPREREVLQLVSAGATNLEVAARLGLSAETVKSYLRSAMRKLDVHTRAAAAHAAQSKGVW